MTVLSVSQASANFAKLLERVEAGEEVSIALGLGPPVKLEALSRRSKKRLPGKYRAARDSRPSMQIGKSIDR
jgi:antitoxin (DNA-binding transcriptional repressor) of toxin-antitoxin stability system